MLYNVYNVKVHLSKQTKGYDNEKKNDNDSEKKTPIKSDSDYSENEGERECCAMSVLVDMGLFLFASNVWIPKAASRLMNYE